MDFTHSQTYSHQYRNAFNAHYKTQGFHPLMVFDEINGDCLKVELLAGKMYILQGISFLFSRYQKKFPLSYPLVRKDSGFAHKELYKLCGTLNTNSVIHLKANATLYHLANEVADVFFNNVRFDIFNNSMGSLTIRQRVRINSDVSLSK